MCSNIFKVGMMTFLLTILLTACQKPMFNPKSAEYAPIVELQTSLGDVEIQLFANTPKHRDNFLKLVKKGFYDSLLFHRVIPEFMIQGGDPDSKDAAPGKALGMGGPGYTVPAEFVKSDTGLANIHLKGMLAAARQGDAMNPTKASSGSQFYIVEGKEVPEDLLEKIENFRGFKYSEAQIKRYKELGGTPHLDGEYTVFGQVIKGLDVIEKISKVVCDGMNRPKEDVRIIKVRVTKG